MDSRAVYATPCLAMQRNAIRCRMRSKHDLASLESMLPARTFCRIKSMVRRLPSAARIAWWFLRPPNWCLLSASCFSAFFIISLPSCLLLALNVECISMMIRIFSTSYIPSFLRR